MHASQQSDQPNKNAPSDSVSKDKAGWPSKTGNPSGKGRGNNSPSKSKK